VNGDILNAVCSRKADISNTCLNERMMFVQLTHLDCSQNAKD